MADQTTFIPKTTFAKIPYRPRGLGWFNFLAFILFIAALLLSLGLFFYRGLLQGQIDSLSITLKKVESEFEPALLIELQNTARGIREAKNLLGKHTAVSRLFEFLEENTISDVHFSNFSYQEGRVSLNGTARSYTALAEQSLVFEKSRLIKDVSFADFNLSPEGFVNFKAEFEVSNELISYQPR